MAVSLAILASSHFAIYVDFDQARECIEKVNLFREDGRVSGLTAVEEDLDITLGGLWFLVNSPD